MGRSAVGYRSGTVFCQIANRYNVGDNTGGEYSTAMPANAT